MRFVRSFIGLAFITASLLACSGGTTTGTGGGGSSGGNGESSSPTEKAPPDGEGSSGSSGPKAPVGPACQDEDGCPNWFCDCAEGPPVNARFCDNGRCASAEDTCPKACSSFGTTWLGTAGGGWSGGSSSGGSSSGGSSSGGSSSGGSSSGGSNGCGDGTAFSDLGITCVVPSECQSNVCVGTNQHSFCTKACATSDNCPKGWVCGQLAGSTAKACLIGDVNKTSPQSTNAGCAQRTFSDIGNACTSYTQCQSEVCGGSTVVSQRYCTKRCNSPADCPAGYSCFTGTGDTLRTCRK